MIYEIILLLLVLFSNIAITGSWYPLVYVLVAIVHECAHVFTMLCCSGSAGKLSFVGFGIRIDKMQALSYRQEIFVALAGPMINLIIALLLIMFYCFCPSKLVLYLLLANLTYFVLNMLPLPPLDGYKILKNILALNHVPETATTILRSIEVSVLALIITVLLFLFKTESYNISLCLISVILIINTLLEWMKA